MCLVCHLLYFGPNTCVFSPKLQRVFLLLSMHAACLVFNHIFFYFITTLQISIRQLKLLQKKKYHLFRALNIVYRIQKAVKLYFVEQVLITLKCHTVLVLLFCEEAAEIKEKSWLLLDLMITNYMAVVAARDRKKKKIFFF